MTFDYKYLIGAKGIPNPETTNAPRPEDSPFYDPKAKEKVDVKPVKVTVRENIFNS
jgi:hypothetical protein